MQALECSTATLAPWKSIWTNCIAPLTQAFVFITDVIQTAASQLASFQKDHSKLQQAVHDVSVARDEVEAAKRSALGSAAEARVCASICDGFQYLVNCDGCT
jgi:hypothetical protein